MSERKKKTGFVFRIVSQAQVPPMRSRHQAFFEALDAEIQKLPRGKAIELRMNDCEIKTVEVIRHHVAKRQKEKILPDESHVIGRASPDGQICYILMLLKAGEKHD